MIDWDDLTKDECILCIKRNNETNKICGYEWSPQTREYLEKAVSNHNLRDNIDFHYEICDDEDIRFLAPLPLSQRQRDLNDLYGMLKDLSRDLSDIESELSNMRYTFDNFSDGIEKHLEQSDVEKD